MSSTKPETPTHELVARCKGQRIDVLNLFGLSPTWKPRVNVVPDSAVLSQLDSWRERWISSRQILVLNQKTNVPFFVRTTCPDSAEHKLCVMAKWISFIFAYDDALDYGHFQAKPSEREVYRCDAIKCFRDTILKDRAAIGTTYRLIQGFGEIGRAIYQDVEEEELREWICDYLCDYVDAAVELEDFFETGLSMSVEQYLKRRMNTSGVYPSLSLYIYSDNIRLPRWLLDHDLIRRMMTLLNQMISIDNDIFSFKKELDLGRVDNLVPLLMHEQNLTAQEGVDTAVSMIHGSYLEFVDLEACFLAEVPEDFLFEVKRLIQCWKDLRTGSVNWHYASGRYFVQKTEIGPLRVVL